MNAATATEQQQPVFSVEKLYVRGLTLDIPHAPTIFLEVEGSHIDLEMHTQVTPLEGDKGLYDVTLTVTANSQIASKDKMVFTIEVKQSGIFRVQNMPQQELEQVLWVLCPNILYPYLREVVSNAVTHAGFAPLILNPVNFEILYRQQKEQAAAEAAAAEATPSTSQ